MISKKVFKSFLFCALLVALSSLQAVGAEENPLARFSKILPEEVGEFRKIRKDEISNGKEQKENQLPKFNRYYELKSGVGIFVTIFRENSEDDAYSLWSLRLKNIPAEANLQKCEIGTACFKWQWAIGFTKGTEVVLINTADARMSLPANEKLSDFDKTILTLANLISDNVEKGEGEIPPLVKHLPDWENLQTKAIYVRNLDSLKSALTQDNSPYLLLPKVFEGVTFVEGTEAVLTKYDKATLVIIEHPTPQIATDEDQRIQQKIAELKSQNQPVPTAYKRVGNYSVFVFDAPDEAAANNLISKIDYGKTVQWLGHDPYEYDRANRKYLLAAGGIIITVLKTAGIALLVCFALGGSFGYFVFMRRRRQQAMSTAFSDAGGMLRLNLDEMTVQTDPTRLLEKANK